MNKPTITNEQLVVLFPKSYKNVSDVVSPENLTTFIEEVAEINARLDSQCIGNEKLTADLTAEKENSKKVSDENTLLRADKVNLSNEVARLKPFEAKIQQITSKGKGLPNTDAGSTNTETVLSANHPNSMAIAQWKLNNGI
jgi:hypothetical protein